jgi:hypothetical protein
MGGYFELCYCTPTQLVGPFGRRKSVTTSSDKSSPSTLTVILAVAGIIGGIAAGSDLMKDWFGTPAVTTEKVEQLTRVTDELSKTIKPLASNESVEKLANRIDVLAAKRDAQMSVFTEFMFKQNVTNQKVADDISHMSDDIAHINSILPQPKTIPWRNTYGEGTH